MLNGKKLLIFDCDGVLIDSHNANRAYFDYCLEMAGYPPLRGEERELVAYMSIEQLITTVFKDNTKEAHRVYEISKTLAYDPFLDLIELKFNFSEVLIPLRKKFFLAVASNRARSLVTLFKHFGLFNYFHYKISSLDAPAKPNPEMLFRCIDYFGVSREESLFLGDSISDYTAAQNAGISYIWVGDVVEEPRISSVRDLLDSMV